MIKLTEMNEVNNRVIERVRKPTMRRKLDISFISFVSSIILLVVTLILVFVFLILPNLNKEVDPLIDNNNTNLPTPLENIDEEETAVEETPKILSISQVDSVNYEITGFSDNQELAMLINFKSNAYVRIRVDGDTAVNLPSKLYGVGTTLDFKFNATNQTVVEVYIGWMNGNSMLINDLTVPVNEEIASRNGSVTFTFRFKGEN